MRLRYGEDSALKRLRSTISVGRIDAVPGSEILPRAFGGGMPLTVKKGGFLEGIQRDHLS